MMRQQNTLTSVSRRDVMQQGINVASVAALGTGIFPAALAPTPSFAQDGQEPLGGQPPKGAAASIKDFDYQIKYQRAFEAVLWNMPAIAIYSIRVGFALDSGTALVGFYVEHWGWQWLYWQGVVIAPLMGLMVYLGTPAESVNRDLLRNADWGGMLLLGTAVAMIYAGLDQGNRLDWLESGTVMALLIGGGVLFLGFMINETLVRQPWAHFNVLFSRNVGLALLAILLYTLTSLSNSSLVPNFLIVVASMRPEQSGVLLLTVAVFVWSPAVEDGTV